MSEEQKSQFEDSSTKSERNKSMGNKNVKIENSKSELSQESLKLKNRPQGNFAENLNAYLDENTIVVRFKEKNPVLEEKIQSLMVKSDEGWSCTDCGKINRKVGKIRKHVETHIEGFSHLCPQCEKMCKTTNGLHVHVKTKHQESSYVSDGEDDV